MNAIPPESGYELQLRQAQFAVRAGHSAAAERVLRALLGARPGEPNAQWLLGVALLDQGRLPESLALFEQLLARAPKFLEARVDHARALRQAQRLQEARTEVRRVLEPVPRHHRAWLAYGDILVDLGQFEDAAIAFERARETDPQRARIEAATADLTADRRREAEEAFRSILQADPGHVAALTGLAAVSLAADAPRDSERLLRHALRQSAHVPLAWRGLGPALVQLGRIAEADAAARHVLRLEPNNPQSWITIAAVAIKHLRAEEALEAYEKAAEMLPSEVRVRMSIGHVQKTLGRRADSEASYRAALGLDPGHAEAYWSLADLKNYRFGEEEIARMQLLLREDPRGRLNEAQLHFALGRGLEQRERYAESFAHYAQGNALRRLDEPFNIENFERRTRRIIEFFTPEYFRARAGAGNPSRAPIFIVGLPRSGSTLIEQILASHSQVEGTMELPNIVNLAYEFDDRVASRNGYPETLAAATPGELTALGTRYLEETAPLRTGRAHFTDKLPNNFNHIGLIRSILPGATVIDARRHPLDTCFSTFRQNFASGQAFGYDLEDLGRYYRCYLELMDHWDRVLPGTVLRVQYEDVVREPELQIRRLLTHCGLAFESACLNFHENRRAVRTASAEQVRQPLYSSGVGYWHHFEAQLAPLKAALGDALDRFQNGPA